MSSINCVVRPCLENKSKQKQTKKTSLKFRSLVITLKTCILTNWRILNSRHICITKTEPRDIKTLNPVTGNDIEAVIFKNPTNQYPTDMVKHGHHYWLLWSRTFSGVWLDSPLQLLWPVGKVGCLASIKPKRCLHIMTWNRNQ